MNIIMATFISLLESLLIAAIILSSCYDNSYSHVAACTESEKQALVNSKQDLTDPSSRLSSWDAEIEDDCCKWIGIVCDNITGHVRELHLQNPYDDYDYLDHPYADQDAHKRLNLGGQINPSLLNLKHLSYLDLSGNDFEGIPIPNFIGSLSSLRYLNLSRAGFGGTIPPHLGNLSSLQSLGLRGSLYSSVLDAGNIEWLSTLSSLEHLDMSYVSLKKAPSWLQVINKLSYLVELRLSQCQLDSIPDPLHNLNFTSLSLLDISSNNFRNLMIPNWIFSLSNLVSLDLSSNKFVGPIASGLQNMTSLRRLDMSGNYVNSTIPNWLYNLSHLEVLKLKDTFLQGGISSAIRNLTSVITLDLSNNELEGKTPSSLLGDLCNLRELDLSSNKLEGEISELFLQSPSQCSPTTLESLKVFINRLSGHLTDQVGRFKNLKYLGISSNSISGPIPKSIGKLSKLQRLDIDNNLLEGVISEAHLANLTALRFLFAGENRVSVRISPNWKPPFQLQSLNFKGLNLGPEFPMWLRSQKDGLRNLDLSFTRIADRIPDWFWNISSQFSFLELSHNQIHGQLPYILNSESLFLSSNKLTGTLPRVSSTVNFLDLSNNSISGDISHFLCDEPSELLHLNLEDNLLSGEIPNCWMNWNSAPIIQLRNNNLTGKIPVLSSNITFLDLSNNSLSGDLSHFLCDKKEEPNIMDYLNLEKNLLSGEIPNCWMNWNAMAVIKLGGNKLSGNIPSSMGTLARLKSLHLRRNSLSGQVPSALQNCTILEALDLGENHFVGRIPNWLGDIFSKLMILGLRSNKFHGEIPSQLCYLQNLQILDLANNSLSGSLPRCLGNLTAMTVRRTSFDYNYILGFWESAIFGEFIDNAFVVTKGREVQYDKILRLVSSLDLSNNFISGEIPKELTTLLGLTSLNLSNNHLVGKIPDKIGDMNSLESIDLSINKLSGEIPPSMSGMTFLSHLNVSYNNLTGKIPLSTQLQSFNASSFIGNAGLCGAPLAKNCRSTDGVTKPDIPKGGDIQVDGFYLSMGIGFVLSFWGVCGPLLYSSSRRRVYYHYLERMWYKLSVVFSKYMHLDSANIVLCSCFL